MESLAAPILANLRQTALDVLPIIVVIGLFQATAFRRFPPRMGRILMGAVAIILGITLFRTGLDLSLLPMGDGLAESLAARVYGAEYSTLANALWLILFAASLGFAATLIEPTLTAVADRVRDLSGGALRPFSFRLVVAAGVACGLALGTTRILLGFPYLYLMAPLVLLTAVLAVRSPRALAPLALDSGPMATSVVTVPVIATFGASLARNLPGRDPLSDGFGLVLLALLTPVCGLLAFAWVQLILARKAEGGGT